MLCALIDKVTICLERSKREIDCVSSMIFGRERNSAMSATENK